MSCIRRSGSGRPSRASTSTTSASSPFGFVVFWAYIAFSQYMLIWYANIPEETVWFQPRQADNWWIGVSLLLLFGDTFVAPFLH